MGMSRRPRYWILDGHTPVPTRSVLEWGQMFERMDRHVARDIVEQPESDPVTVSTVFLGIDHNFFGSGPPLLFESMVFGGPLDEETYRYPTWDAAAEGHKLLLDETVLEGKVSAWEVREQIKAMSSRAWAAQAETREQIKAVSARSRKAAPARTVDERVTVSATAKRRKASKGDAS